jgi:asparagine synthase (glutamine-hydrolysing)
MCGISAILSTSAERIPNAETIGRMNDALQHRGPDGAGIELFTGRNCAVGLGHRRLSIIDLAGGGQPMSNEDGTVWITYNGEIYNHLDIRAELIARGHRYSTRCDTETIVHAYEEWGEDCVHRFRGMFAFVIWDSRENRLFAARDRMGIKPLYYSFEGGVLLCASEIKALIASGWCTPQLNLEALPERLALGYLAGASTLFRGINKLLPGHWMSWKDGDLESKQYWEIPLPKADFLENDEAELVNQFLHLFRESVRLRLMSDVPLGVFLSGGLDSSAIAATMAQQMSEPVKTFSVGFESEYYSEFDFAREVASSIGAVHHQVVLKPDRLFANLPRLIWHEDKPIRNASSVALYEVANLAQSHVKVVLTGEGGDELFAGYERYWATLFNAKWGSAYHQWMPEWLQNRCIRGTLWQWPLPLSIKKRLSHTFLNHAPRPEEIVYDNWHAVFPPHVHSRLFTPETWNCVKHVAPYHETMQHYRSRDAGNLLDQLLFTDQKTYLVELLRKQDTMSMAASIESRVPFLDHHLVEFASSVPNRYKIRGTQGKYLVKRAMRQLLPDSIIRRKKMGFPVPLNQWLRNGFNRVVRSVLLSDRTEERGILSRKYIEELLRDHDSRKRDNTEALWTILNFELWTRIFIDGDGHASVASEMKEALARQSRDRDHRSHRLEGSIA